ncbi:hypothetical protein CYMTET_28727 [Cymbomonas tetramitiformis]|uniref:Uncharacterized protein n=1 Tax=Cymbomonas tetramitiformis TaxID=36881 RepID=A0AAE0FNV9_9CHLO|nr:hypothetical protein CYMTET_28727 [Cymbomonas tetramitiformis]
MAFSQKEAEVCDVLTVRSAVQLAAFPCHLTHVRWRCPPDYPGRAGWRAVSSLRVLVHMQGDEEPSETWSVESGILPQ